MVVSTGSGQKTASECLVSAPCNVTAIEVITDGTNPATVIAYDGLDDWGKVIAKWVVAGADNQGERSWQFPRKCETGLYVAVSGTGASYIAEWTAV